MPTDKAKKKGRKNHKLTNETLEFIIDKMAEGLSIAQIHEQFPDKCPPYDSIHNKSAKDDSWKEGIDKGYTLWLYSKLEELDTISTTDSKLLFPNIEDFRERSEARRVRVDALKFVLGKMAPTLSKRFDKTTKVEIEGTGMPQLAVINYYSDSSGKTDKLIDVSPSKDD